MIDFTAYGSQESVIGCLMQSGATSENVELISTMPNDAFTDLFLRDSFIVIKKLIEHGENTDLMTVDDELTRLCAKSNKPVHEQGFQRLGNILHMTHANASSAGHARKLKECYRIRSIQKTMHDMNEAINTGADISKVASILEKEISLAAGQDGAYQTATAKELVLGYADHLDAKMGELGIRTGFHVVDKMLGRVSAGNMIVLGGRSGQGKTEFACAWALNAAEMQGKNVVFFSMEMSKEEIMDRFVAIKANISPSLLDNPIELDASDWGQSAWPQVTAALSAIENLDLHVHDQPDMKLSQIKAVLKKVERDTGRPVDIVFIDYLQNMCRTIYPSVYESVAANSRGTKQLAKEFAIPFVQLAQLSREVEKQNRDPKPSDIRECGQIEADADKIIFIVSNEDEHNQGLKKIVFAKMRQGKKGDVAIGFKDGHFHDTDQSYMDDDDIQEYRQSSAKNERKEKTQQAYGSLSNKKW
ncbi:helicase [Shewanella sp. phage 3/49]|uniref:DnaB-like replicative helicase n=1 Tax=Shewanella sp. phage 3/49 TaxID=1458863 RepID=UPI0004F7CA22|nr:DnaB-like replicative helicase [Shewanella sp. phage 3/49]AHK11850.1 helicase [Shewanella sp. phage 3/49]